MSGICGLFNLDGAPVAEAELRAMTVMLERRGPEGTGRWREGPVSLGHTLLATTPELRFERQPFRHAATGCVITADVRLDNRDELLGRLGLGGQRKSIGDTELILSAYLEWGEACLEQLLGDFAFALWDSRHRKLFCARDHFGMRAFCYHHAPGKRFLFASDARAIIILPQVPYRINEGRVADFLVPELEWIDYTSTFFQGVYRLPPGHKLSVTPERCDVVEYWKPEPGQELGPMSDDDYREGFLDVFTQAVEARLRAPAGSVGSMLSGGMDSGTVVAVAKDILSTRGHEPIPTFSGARRRDTGCLESEAIYAAVSMLSASPSVIRLDALHTLVAPLTEGLEEPFDGEMTMLRAIYFAAREQGQSVVLDGAGGDVVLGEGSYVVRLIRSGHLRLALNEIGAEGELWGGSTLLSALARYSRAALVPQALKKPLRPLIERRRVKHCLRQSLISRDFAIGVDILGRFEQLSQSFPSEWTRDYAAERCNAVRPNMTAGRERYGRSAAAAATEARDPFLDKRVVDYCTRLPGHMRLRNGWPKIILRELMTDKLPNEVLWARRKPHLGWLFNAVASRQASEADELCFGELQARLGDYVDSAALQEAWRTFVGGGDAVLIHSARILSNWLRESAKRPVVPN